MQVIQCYELNQVRYNEDKQFDYLHVKMVVDVDKKINVKDLVPNTRVALREDAGHVLHKIMPSKVDPLVSLMKVEKVPDSTYDMIGGLE